MRRPYLKHWQVVTFPAPKMPQEPNEAYFNAVRALTKAKAALKPWTLHPIPGELKPGEMLIAVDCTLWNRLRTSWANVARRKEAKLKAAAQAAYFAPQAVAERLKKSQ